MTIIVRVFLIILISSWANAAYFDVNLGLLQGKTETANANDNSRSISTVGVYAHLNKAEAKTGLLLGWNIASVNVKDELTNPAFSQKLTSTDMGPAFRWYYGSELVYSLTYIYGISCKGKYDENGTEESLNGSSQLIRLSAEAKLADKLLLGISVNSYTASYTSSVANNIQSDVSYQNNWVYPSLSLAFQF
jgi:hypothetical protein